MAKHIELGKLGENIATQYLIGKGYSLVERNYRQGRGEVDIIVKNTGGAYVFVEVKTRWNYEKPEEAVNKSKLKLLLDTIEGYKMVKNIEAESFVDIIAINFRTKTDYKIAHFEDLWLY